MTKQYNYQQGEESIKRHAPLVYDELKKFQSTISKTIRNTKITKHIKSIIEENGWQLEWPIPTSQNMDIRADAYKDHIVMELEFGNRDICYRDIMRFMKLFKEQKIEAAVIFTFADKSAAERWGKKKTQGESTAYLTLDYLQKALDEFKQVIDNTPIWCIGIQ